MSNTGEDLSKSANDIKAVCSEIESMLIAKNHAYGDSALDPIRIFSHTHPTEQILVRIDDKLSRIKMGRFHDTEDVELDLIGYLILLRVQRRREAARRVVPAIPHI